MLPVGPKGLSAWITNCSSELATLVSALPFPILFLANMASETLRNFGHAIIARLNWPSFGSTPGTLTSIFASSARDGQRGNIRWTTTDSIQRWRRVRKMHPELICATVVEPLSSIDHWGVLNVLCILLPDLAPVDAESNVVLPQTKAAVYHTS